MKSFQECLELSIKESQNLFLFSNSTFLAERLFYEIPSEQNLSILAECYLYENKIYKVYELLKLSESERNKYLFALSCFKLKKYAEAEKTIKITEKPLRYICRGKGSYLLGLIYEIQGKNDLAKQSYLYSLTLNPTLWTVFERLSKLESLNVDEIFNNAIFEKFVQNLDNITLKDINFKNYNRKINTDPKFMDLLNIIAKPLELMQERFFNEAIEGFSKLDTNHYNSGYVLNCVAKCQMELRNYEVIINF